MDSSFRIQVGPPRLPDLVHYRFWLVQPRCQSWVTSASCVRNFGTAATSPFCHSRPMLRICKQCTLSDSAYCLLPPAKCRLCFNLRLYFCLNKPGNFARPKIQENSAQGKQGFGLQGKKVSSKELLVCKQRSYGATATELYLPLPPARPSSRAQATTARCGARHLNHNSLEP